MTGGHRPWNVSTAKARILRKDDSQAVIEYCMACPFVECHNCLQRLPIKEQEKVVQKGH